MDVIDTSTMAGDDVQPDAIDTAAGKIRASGAAVSTTATSTRTAWTKISASYEAPEQGQLFTAMNPVTKEAEVFETDLGTAATALETFAETVRTIKAAVVTIRADVSTFENKIAADGTIQPSGGYNPYAGGMKLRIQWNEDKGMVAEHNRLTAAVNAQWDALRAAEITCANSIDDITGAAHVPTSGPGAPPPAPHMEDARWYLTAPIDRPEDCGQRIAHGVVIDFVGGGVSGALGLIGVKFDTTTGDFGNFFHTLGESWGGLLKLSVGANPLIWGPLSTLGAGKYVDESRRTAWSFLNDQVARDPYASDPWHRWKEDPLRAGSYTVVSLATWLLPPLKALTAAKAAKAAELAGDAAKVGDLAKAGEVTRFGSAADLVKALRESGSLKSLRELPETLRARLAATGGKASDLVHAGDDLKTPQLSHYDLTADRANPRVEVPVRDGGPGPLHQPSVQHHLDSGARPGAVPDTHAPGHVDDVNPSKPEGSPGHPGTGPAVVNDPALPKTSPVVDQQVTSVVGGIGKHLQLQADLSVQHALERMQGEGLSVKHPDPRILGTYAHKDFADAVKREADQIVDPKSGYELAAEQSFDRAGNPVSSGTKGSLRPDLVLYRETLDPLGQLDREVVWVWDYKTGAAGISGRWDRAIQKALTPLGPSETLRPPSKAAIEGGWRRYVPTR